MSLATYYAALTDADPRGIAREHSTLRLVPVPRREMTHAEIARRYPRLLNAMTYAACLTSSEATSAIQAHQRGQESAGEAVNHFGGVSRLLERATSLQTRTIARVAYGPRNPEPRARWATNRERHNDASKAASRANHAQQDNPTAENWRKAREAQAAATAAYNRLAGINL